MKNVGQIFLPLHVIKINFKNALLHVKDDKRMFGMLKYYIILTLTKICKFIGKFKKKETTELELN